MNSSNSINLYTKFFTQIFSALLFIHDYSNAQVILLILILGGSLDHNIEQLISCFLVRYRDRIVTIKYSFYSSDVIDS